MPNASGSQINALLYVGISALLMSEQLPSVSPAELWCFWVCWESKSTFGMCLEGYTLPRMMQNRTGKHCLLPSYDRKTGLIVNRACLFSSLISSNHGDTESHDMSEMRFNVTCVTLAGEWERQDCDKVQ